MTHEEANIIIANQVVPIARQTLEAIPVISDDTDVFVLLIHFYSFEYLHNDIFMIPTQTSRSVVNISG